MPDLRGGTIFLTRSGSSCGLKILKFMYTWINPFHMAMLFLSSLKPFLSLVLMWHFMYSNIAETETYAIRMDSIMMWEHGKLLLFNIHL